MSDEYEEKCKHVIPIAKPLASEKLCTKVLKLCKKANKVKMVKRGVKEVVKAVRKKNKGLVVLAGDIWPLDVITHVPVLCEDHDIPYVYVPSKEHLANATETKRPTSCLMVLKKPMKKQAEEPDDKLKDLFKKVDGKVRKLEFMP